MNLSTASAGPSTFSPQAGECAAMNEIPHTIHGFTADHLARLNSATQYPSILTYHALGERGRLPEDRTTHFPPLQPRPTAPSVNAPDGPRTPPPTPRPLRPTTSGEPRRSAGLRGEKSVGRS